MFTAPPNFIKALNLHHAFSFFIVLLVLWMTRSITGDIPGWAELFNVRAGDGTISDDGNLVVHNSKQEANGLTDILSKALDFLEEAPHLAIVPAICLISETITEFMSNNATTTLVIPLLVQIAHSMHVHPLLLLVPRAIGAQFAFLLPIGSPSNVVGFSMAILKSRI
ncbi:hypothetical protein FEM48_Zijuj01G0081100 [Ziziphus jujuba var. spinosa]|uniref:Uncharacterized protein n=1 Tax=Ziziphus jujuba var. spinosa TaxID=714518 RepID=A0A978W037_ZIZJJ|nr:hypothetical protein FEM48_Zijuj01G0081100 [Ziziphus jujuba var. spinosa]